GQHAGDARPKGGHRLGGPVDGDGYLLHRPAGRGRGQEHHHGEKDGSFQDAQGPPAPRGAQVEVGADHWLHVVSSFPSCSFRAWNRPSVAFSSASSTSSSRSRRSMIASNSSSVIRPRCWSRSYAAM